MYFAPLSAAGLPAGLPARATIAAMIGDDTLVPPTTVHPPCTYTATPVAGSATAEMSDAVRIGQCVSFCQAGLAMYPEQPDPVPFHAVSAQPRALPALRRLVPPTAMTPASDAGQLASMNPASPLEAVTATPACAKFALNACASVVSSPPQLFDTATAPEPVAAFSAVPSAAVLASSDSTSRRWHCGHTAETMSRSSDTSMLQSSAGSNLGSGEAFPF